MTAVRKASGAYPVCPWAGARAGLVVRPQDLAHGGRVHAWEIHALNGPDDEDGAPGLAAKARGRTGTSGCLRLGPEAARSIQAMFTRGETPLLAVAQQHYVLGLGPAGDKVRGVTLTQHVHQHAHAHGCGCGHGAE